MTPFKGETFSKKTKIQIRQRKQTKLVENALEIQHGNSVATYKYDDFPGAKTAHTFIKKQNNLLLKQQEWRTNEDLIC